jgi:hypothetical protein
MALPTRVKRKKASRTSRTSKPPRPITQRFWGSRVAEKTGGFAAGEGGQGIGLLAPEDHGQPLEKNRAAHGDDDEN